MNFIFISPHIPHTYWEFCRRLKQNGVNVLGLADAPYEELDQQLKDSLTEYYRVGSLEDYDQVYRAVAYFAIKYGRIDWIESNNEYWLAQDARLRTDFNVTSGIQTRHIDDIKEKSSMHRIYRQNDIPTARQQQASAGLEAALSFASLTGYNLIAKPNIGVGANDTHKIHNDDELRWVFDHEPHGQDYVLEEFITGEICSYDAVIDSHGDPLFESMTVWPPSIMDIVNKQLELSYYVDREMPEALRSLGRRTVKAFGVVSRFVHLEFFRLDRDKPQLGNKGDFVALEVNMRPAGGYTPDMMNYAHSTDVYKIWADMVAYDTTQEPVDNQYYCAYASRRDIHRYVHSHEEVTQRYASSMVMCERLPEIFSAAMGQQMYTVRLGSLQEVKEFVDFVQSRQ